MRKLTYILLPIFLNLFTGNTNVTTDADLTEEMKKYYSDYMIDIAEPELVHDQFGQKHPIPKNGGKTIQFRKYSPLPKLTSALSEGVTPDGQKLAMSVLEATVVQYGGYVELSDMLLMTAIDNNQVEATKLLGGQAGRTLDTITRNVLVAGTNVQYGEDAVAARYLLVGGESTGNHYMTVDCVKRAVRDLKKMNAKKIGGMYVVVINPDIAYDLTRDTEWKYPHQYVDTANLYSGELGSVAGCRFVETTEAKIFKGADLTAGARSLTVKTTLSEPGTTLAVDEVITEADATALVGRKVVLNGHQYTVASASNAAAGSATITMTGNVTVADGEDGKVLYPGEGGAKGRAVYATLVLADNAYGVTEISGGGLQYFAKQLGSAGTADPLNQRATVGWKATKVAKRLVEEYMVRIETCSTYDEDEN